MPHIPSAPTAELSILPFADAMARSGQSGGYDAEKWLYVPDFYTEYRYLLGTRGEKPLVCIGINPSTAEPDRLDPTLQSVVSAVAPRMPSSGTRNSIIRAANTTPVVRAT